MLRAKPGSLHGLLRFGILHELLPDETGAMIFRHQHGDAEIDGEIVGVILEPSP